MKLLRRLLCRRPRLASVGVIFPMKPGTDNIPVIINPGGRLISERELARIVQRDLMRRRLGRDF